MACGLSFICWPAQAYYSFSLPRNLSRYTYCTLKPTTLLTVEIIYEHLKTLREKRLSGEPIPSNSSISLGEWASDFYELDDESVFRGKSANFLYDSKLSNEKVFT